jgi:hypothetical protein
MFKSRCGRMMVVVRCVTCDMYAVKRWRPRETVDQEGERNGGEVEKGVLKRFPAAGSSCARSERKSNTMAYDTVLRKLRVQVISSVKTGMKNPFTLLGRFLTRTAHSPSPSALNL